MFNPVTLFYILIFCVVLIIIQIIIRLCDVRAWIRTKFNKGVWAEVAYLKYYNGGEASEVFLSGGNSSLPIARVIIGESQDNNGYVEILSSDYEDTSTNPSYRKCGYVTQDGYIYKKLGKNGRPERIGYTARPSQPNQPTSVGERSWRTLWLVCTLHAYFGTPEKTVEEETDSAKKKNDSKAVQSYRIQVFNNDAQNEGTSVQEDVPLEANASELEQNDIVNEQQAESAEDIEDTSKTTDSHEHQVDSANDTNNEDTSKADSPQMDDEEVDSSQTETAEEEKSQEDAVKTDEKQSEKEEKQDNKKSKKNKKKNTPKKRVPDAIIKHYGFHNSKNDALSPESRACAFALLSERYNKNHYTEYYRSRPYGWLDTALLSSFVYSLLFLIGYVLVTYVWRKPYIGTNSKVAYEFMAFYFVLWAMIRQLKIYSIESLNTIQPKLDLFNKSLGHFYMDLAIIVFCLLAYSFIGNYYTTLDWEPLLFAIFMGVSLNFFLKSSKDPWVIKNSLYDNEELDYEEGEEPKNPDGDIAKTYDWDLDSRISDAKLHGSLTLYFTAATITDIRQINPFFAQLKEKTDKDYIMQMFHYMKEHKSMLARLRYLTYKISKLCDKHGLHELDRVQFILDFVQEPNIRFCMNRTSVPINKYEDYIRYPDETLYDKEGDSNSKALLAAMLFHLMKRNVLYLHSRKEQHAAIGVEVKTEWLSALGPKQTIDDMTLDHNGRKYIFCETTGDRFRIVDVMYGMRYDDFEERVELPVIEDGVDDANVTNTQESRFYNWDLDSVYDDHKLHGSFTLEFDSRDMTKLREHNPFITYGQDGATYEANVTSMIEFLRQDVDNVKNIKAIAKYMRESIEKAGLPELDLIQFALDFAQAPNITYRIDEDSANINYAKEYMRFPDEVLYDKEGDCDCKSSLTAALFHELGYNVIIMLSQQIGHAAIGIEYKDDWLQAIGVEEPERVTREYNGKRYLYCETTGDGYRVGHIRDNDSIKDFETIVEYNAD